MDNRTPSHTFRCRVRTKIYLTEEEHAGINALAKATNKRQSEIIRQAIDEYLTRKKPDDKLAKIRKAKGIWKDRADLDLFEIRSSFDRF